MLPHDTQSKGNTQDEDILIGDKDIVPDDGEESLGPDKIEGQGKPPDLMGVDDDQLLAIQNDLREKLKLEMQLEKVQFLENYANLNRNMNSPMLNFLNISLKYQSY